jgi:hypothetical protein
VVHTSKSTSLIDARLLEIQRQIVKTERQSARFCAGRIRRYLEAKIRELEAEAQVLGR